MKDRSALQTLKRDWLSTYEDRNELSRRANAAAEKHIARGQRTRFNSGMPFPVYIHSGKGSRFTDADGNDVLDCNAGWNSSFVGRGNLAVAAAAAEAMERLGAPGGAMHPSPVRDEFAELLCHRTPGADRIVFAPSGSEANTYALRLARSYTGKHNIIRMKGGFHGQHDALLGEQSIIAGTASASRDGIVTVGFNDIDAVRGVLEKFAESTAAIIVEPMMTIPGAVHQRGSFLADLRAEARRHDVLLVVDEVITGSRFAVGGATEFYDLEPPDLIVMGKMLGGGLPTAVVAGRADVVEASISASNTHAQNPVALAAAVAAMHECGPEVFARAADMGERLRTALSGVCDELPIPVQVTGDGPCAGIHFTSDEVIDYDTAERADHDLWRLMCLGLANEGLALSSRTFGPTSVWTEDDLAESIEGFGNVLKAISTAH